MTIATAVAHPNIALVKYWGKRDADLNLPATGSLSMTLDVFPTRSYVAVARGEAKHALEQLRAGRIKGRRFRVNAM